MEDAPKRKKTGGRKKGTPNKSTSKVKERIEDFINKNAEDMQIWFDDLESKDKVKYMLDMYQYAAPKLKSVEVDATVEKTVGGYSMLEINEMWNEKEIDLKAKAVKNITADAEIIEEEE